MTAPLWTPSQGRIDNAQVTRFTRFVNERHDLSLAGFDALYQWSVESDQDFWAAVWDFCGVVASERGEQVLEDPEKFPGARWFPGARLNFAENLLRHSRSKAALDEPGRESPASTVS